MSLDKSLIRVERLSKHFPIKRGGIIQRKVGSIQAVEDVTFTIFRGETLGLVGESGCGKSTLGRTILQLYRPTSGKVFFEDIDLTELQGKELRRIRRHLQIIFQDPCASLDPRMSVGRIISEPLRVRGGKDAKDRRSRVQELLELVGLNPYHIHRFPHEFSGGQLQRVGIARALALQPDLIICDEPISALDVSIQAQVVNLLDELQENFNLTYLFIAHDISMIRYISDRVAVMYLGRIVEMAPRDEFFTKAQHPYTQALLSAIPIPNPARERKRKSIPLKGDVPNPANPPTGCRFHTRCPVAIEVCFQEEPESLQISANHWVSCHLVRH